MSALPTFPAIYEINTWVWLAELSRTHGKALTLSTVPDSEWDDLAAFGFDAVWFMGVWDRSPAGIAIANQNAGLIEDFRRALPDYGTGDNVGSPYCIRNYVVDRKLGGRKGLAAARRALSARGLGLILDFVPNHVAPDHPWAAAHPEYFVRGSQEDLRQDPASFMSIGEHVFARGRDPYFPAWPDVLQLNAFAPGLRQAAIDTVSDIAAQCDGVRCDMAMLLMTDIFGRTWGPRAGERPPSDYWGEVIPSVKRARPEFRFIAEAYWDLEWALQQQGFDFCYDKRLYDRLEHDTAESIRGHLSADLAFQNRLVRFIENHDEPRAAATFSAAKARAAAVTIATIPGATLWHEGQFEGRRIRVPVFLGRRPTEDPDPGLQAFYRTLIKVASARPLRAGEWRLCDVSGWPDNGSYRQIVAWCARNGDARRLVVVNLANAPAQAQVRLPWDDLRGRTWKLDDPFAGASYNRRGDDLCGAGLYVDLPAWGFHVFTGWAAE